jgi:succinate dehydrogenase / fumarate reductase cytochrome b subunit
MTNRTSTSSVGKKILMAISGFFLMIFLLQHLTINFISVISEKSFNEVSHFMGTNPIIQFVLQPLLIFGVIFHLFMGIFLDIQNNKARPIKYAINNPSANSSWVSRNMIVTGLMIFLFLGLHFYDFWIPEIKDKFIYGKWNDSTKYFPHLQHKFHDLWRVLIYCTSFIFLSLHLLHGFQSAFQSSGINSKRYNPTIKKISTIYAIGVPFGFIFICVFHYIKYII